MPPLLRPGFALPPRQPLRLANSTFRVGAIVAAAAATVGAAEVYDVGHLAG